MTQSGDVSIQQKRRKRVDRLKKIIVYGILALILIPTIISVYLGVQLHRVNQQLKNTESEMVVLQEQLAQEEAKVESFKTGIALAKEREAALAGVDNSEEVVVEEDNVQEATIPDDVKRVYLTFDDGPSSNTADILDVLAEYDVKATFFVIGDTGEQEKEIYKRIVEEGHSIGVHSFSHRYAEIYASEEAFFEDFYMMSDYVYDVTGVRPTICRLPGGSSNTVSNISMADVVNELEEQGVTCFDWNISGGDADGRNLSSGQIAARVISGVDSYQTSVVLLHDGKGKRSTAEALRLILEELTTREDIVFEPITEETPIILHITH